MAVAKPRKPMTKDGKEFYPLTSSEQVICNDDGTRLDAVLDELSPVTTRGYESLSNKPKINGVTLIGNKTSANLGLQDALTAGVGIKIQGSIISVKDLLFDCGTATTNIGE